MHLPCTYLRDFCSELTTKLKKLYFFGYCDQLLICVRGTEGSLSNCLVKVCEYNCDEQICFHLIACMVTLGHLSCIVSVCLCNCHTL